MFNFDHEVLHFAMNKLVLEEYTVPYIMDV